MTMDAIEAMEQRAGCRKYTDEVVDRELLGLVLDAGRVAPSAGNLQDRSFIVVKEEATRNAIADACGNQVWMKSAPIHIIIVSEHKKTQKFYGDRGEKIYAIQDAAFSAENMLIAATHLGLGSSLVVGFKEEVVGELLKIPVPAKAYAIITLGHAQEKEKPSVKYPLERFVFLEAYDRKVENLAVAFGEWSTARKQTVEKLGKESTKATKSIVEKIKSLFSRKKPEVQLEDHFMEDKKEEIPRQLPKQ